LFGPGVMTVTKAKATSAERISSVMAQHYAESGAFELLFVV
jgi:hypothetical protein